MKLMELLASILPLAVCSMLMPFGSSFIFGGITFQKKYVKIIFIIAWCIGFIGIWCNFFFRFFK